MPMVRGSRCLLLERLTNQDVSKVLEIYRADIVLNARVGRQRSCLKLIDNCTAHPHVEQLASIELIFLPPNTTSHTQPMDQGVIRALKAKYRSLAVRKLIAALEKKIPVPTNHIHSICYGHAGKGLECCFEQNFL